MNYLTEGRNKFHVTLDLEKPEAREILKGFVAQADVLIETYRPGVMDSWGLGYEELKKINPRLIFASITPFGQFGPKSKSKQPDYDNVTQARSGIQYDTGEMMPEGKSYDECPWAVPTKAGPWIGWCEPGTYMAVGYSGGFALERNDRRGTSTGCSPLLTLTPLLMTAPI